MVYDEKVLNLSSSGLGAFQLGAITQNLVWHP